MANLEVARKLTRALSGEAVDRVLRSQNAMKVLQNVKLVNARIAFKVRKGAREAAEKGKLTGKSKTGATLAVIESAVEEGGGTVAERGKRLGKKTRKVAVDSEATSSSLFTGLTATTSGRTELPSLVSNAVRKDTLSISESETWKVTLSTAEAIAEATKHLISVDTKLGDVIGAHGVCHVWVQEGTCFTALARSIVYQQISGKAAQAIYYRLVSLCGGPESVTPSVIAALTAEELRTAGISGRKGLYLHDLAEKFTSGFLSEEKLIIMNEDDLVQALTAVKGIGVWSAHMFMIFYLRKPDVLPVGDLAIRKAFQKLYHLKQLPSPTEMQELASPWRPYRTLASWYLWRMTDIKLPSA